MAPIVPRLYEELRFKSDEARSRIRAATRDESRVYSQAKSRAKRKNIAFQLSPADFDLLVTRAEERCEETGKRFERETNSTGRYRDHWMSIDRIDSRGPYSLDNCRLVTAAVNFSKGDQHLQNYHVQKLMYLAKIGGSIDDRFLISREGDDPEKWRY